MKKKIIAVLLSACMLVSACPTGAFAMSDEETNTYTATGDVMQGGTPVVDETPAPEETAAPEETPTPAPEETPTPAPAETPAPVEVEAQATPAAGAEETAPAKQSAETGIALTMLRPDDEKPTVDTYRFYGADGKELTEWQQTVAKGDELLEPPAPTKENARFVGWYVGKTPLSFGEVAAVSGTEVTVTAKFEEYSYVYFMNEDGTKVVYYTAAGVAGENVAEADLNAATAKVELTMGKEKGVVGWSTTQDSNTPDASITFVAGDTYVYPVVKTGFWVTFNTAGGDYVAPQFRMAPLDLSTVTPTRSGYTFTGWLDADGKPVTTVSGTATVTAQWTESSNTQYRVFHWQENANDDGYSLKETETQKGKTGSETKAAAKKYDGFTAETITQQTIAGDGSTIVNVYYKRNVYIVNFYDRKGKKEYTDLRISAKYGANISKKWPTYNGSNTWYVGKNSNTSQVNIDTMPLGGAKFYGPKTGYGSETAYYYVEVLPGESGTTTYNGVQYKLHHSDTSPGTGYAVTKEDKYPITGFTFVGGSQNGQRYNNARFYYDRNSYGIKFVNGTQEANSKTVNYKYEESIENAGFTPTRPSDVKEGFVFAGWYENKLCVGDPFVFTGKTMPAQSITLYAKWQAPIIEAKVYLTASADGEFKTIEILYGTKLSDSKEFKALLENLPEKPSAWIDSNGALFNVDTELYSSVTISPFFPSAKDGFTVTYVEGESKKVDNQKYVSGSSARVLPPENSENFRAWKTEDGKLIHPGDKITVTKNTTLRAVYTNKPQTVTITYHYNFEGSSTQPFIDSGYPKNTTATVKSLSEVKFTAPTGYKFLGWATAPDSNKIEYAAGDPVFVDANGDNDLYAIWQVKTYTVTYDLDGGEWTEATNEFPYEYKATVEVVKTVPTREGYTFADWTSEEVEVANGKFTMPAKNVTLKAKWNINKYTVKWVNWDGSEVRTDTEVPYGTKLEAPANPTRAADAQYTYTFKDWDKPLEKVTKDVTYTAVYDKAVNKYTIKWVNWDGSEVRTDTEVPYGTKLEAPADPTRAADAQYTYTFKDWTPEVKTVTGDATYKATYTKEANTYTLTYDLDGGEWTEATNEFPYEYKATVEVVKTVPTREGYKFSGWRSEEVTIENDAFTMPAKDVVLKAVWEANPTPTPIPSEEPTPTPAPSEEPTPTPAPTEEPTPTPVPTEEPTPTPVPTEEPTPTPAPNPNPNPNPATPTPTPVAPVVPATVATPTPKPTATPSATPSDNGGKGDGNNDGEIGETINDNETPLANGEDIADNATPLAGLGTGAWALINLILTIVTTLLSILLLIGYIGKKKKALEDEDGNVVLDENGKEVMEYEKNKKGLWRLISIIPALIAIIVFIFTEDMTLPMIFVDKWTILHVVIALVQVVVMVLCKKKKNENDEDENAANA
ncbi:InlB B-repeat-containing protein [Hominenteromicrobium sp.]|uniref:InlB B-repeat-containing protein n=1 Tax=Hominenteromicrobium sp. TaxID=3073581 RepID=UPI003AB153B0